MQKLVYLFLFLTVCFVGCETEDDDSDPTSAPCSSSLTDNTLSVDGTALTFSSKSVYYTPPSEVGDFYEYRVSLPSPYRYLYIRLSADKAPDETRTYSVTESSAAGSPAAGYAYLSIQDETGKYFYSGESNDKIYLTVTDSTTTLNLCDVDMFYYDSYQFGMTGRVVYTSSASVPLPCTNLTNNKLTIDGTNLLFNSGNIQYTSPSVTGDFYEYRVSLPSPYRYLYIRLSADKAPTADRTYLVSESSAAESPKDGYAYLSVLDEQGTFYYSGQSNDKLNVSVKDGAISFDLCDVDMFYYYTYKFGITGRVVYGAAQDTPTEAPCRESLTANTLTVNGTKLTFTSNDIDYSAPRNGGNFYEYRLTLAAPYQYLYIRLSADQAPTGNRTYTIGESSAAGSPNAGYAYLSVRDANGYFYYSGVSNDFIYVTVKDGVTTFDLCDVNMYYYSTYKFGITGRIDYKP